jgi:hypothetical protein
VDAVVLEKADDLGGSLSRRWTAKTKSAVTSSVRCDGLLVAGEWSGVVVAYDLETGRVVWRMTSEGAIAEPLVVADTLVWVFDQKGNVLGLDSATGTVRHRHTAKNGGWGVRAFGHHLFFVHRRGRASTSDGAFSRLDLRSGETVELAAGIPGGSGRHISTTRILPASGHVVCFVAPDIVTFRASDGIVHERITLPGASKVSGLAVSDEFSIGLAFLDTGWDSSHGGNRFLEFNPEPLFVAIGDARYRWSLRAMDVRTEPRPSRRADGSYVVELGEAVLAFDGGGIRDVMELPDRSVFGDRSAGGFFLAGELVVARQAFVPDHEGLDLLRVDLEGKKVTPIVPRLITNKTGRNYARPEIDVHDDWLIVRCDGLLHGLALPTALPSE